MVQLALMNGLNGNNIYYPIPEDCLLKRVKPVFDRLSQGYSTAFLGVNGSGRTTHIRFALSDKPLLNKLFSQKRHKRPEIIFISYDSLLDKGVTAFTKAILLEIKKKLVTEKKLQKKIDNVLLINDAYLILEQIKDILTHKIRQNKDFRLLIILDQLDKFIDFDPMIEMVIKSLWQIERKQPIEKVSFLFLGSPLAFFQMDNLLVKTVRFIVGENIIYSPLLSDREIVYSLKRHSRLQGFRLNEKQISFLQSFIGSVGSLIRYSIQIVKDQKDTKALGQEILESSIIRSLALEIWQGLEDKEKIELQNAIRTKKNPDKKSRLYKLGIYQTRGLSADIIRLITPWNVKEENKIQDLVDMPEQMSPQEENLLRFLLKNANKVVNKDQVAEALWGKDYLEKYSDWAMAQLIARLRKKIASYHKPITILTLRNRGYKLVN